MKALFFGDTATKLYGVYHPSRFGAGGDYGVLICSPDGYEYLYSHRTLCQLAGALARRGHHVLRFDYFASGDSAGNAEEATVEQWMADIHTAARELRDLSGREELSIVGLRLGALLAACAEVADVQDLVLWDPVVHGRDYLSQLRQAHRRMLAGAKLRLPAGTPPIPAMGEQLLGFSYPPALRGGIEALDLLAVKHRARRVVLVGCERETAHRRLRRRLEQVTGRFEHHSMLASSRWYAAVEERSIAHPPGTLELLIEALSGGDT